MDGVTLEKAAVNLKITQEELFHLMLQLGIKQKEKGSISSNDQLRLLKHLKAHPVQVSKSNEGSGKSVGIADIKSASSLDDLNAVLTYSMAERKISSLIEGSNLVTIIDRVFELNESAEVELLTAAILGRLAAVARTRENIVFDRAEDIFSQEPGSIESLPDGDAKQYAAVILKYVKEPWVAEYSYREAFVIDTADIARRELLTANLSREATLSDWLSALSDQANQLKEIEKNESRYKRIRRLTTILAEIADPWRGDLGDDPGGHLSRLMKSMFVHGLEEVEFSIILEGLDALLSILRRCIELRFSMALYPELYAIVVHGKHALGAGLWGRFLQYSETLVEVRHSLLEASLVLARQDKFDNDMMNVLRAAFSSRAQMTGAIKRHFVDAKDLDPTVSAWWYKGGGGDGDKEQKGQRIRNSEDEKIGELLLKVEESQSVIEKLSSAVLPILKGLNPVLAKTVAKAASDYRETTQVVRSLSRMRQLKPAGLMSDRMEYNRRQHDMEDGHRSDVRYIRVIRDGIEKTFAGKTRMLVKPIVVPEE